MRTLLFIVLLALMFSCGLMSLVTALASFVLGVGP